MKMFALIAAGLMSVGVIAPAAASAAPLAPIAAPAPVAAPAPQERVVIVRKHTQRTRHYSSRRGHAWGSRRVCKRVYNNGRRITRCRTVRYRR